MTAERMIAAIDIGTNSIHMVIVLIKTALPSFTVLDSQKETVRLGERCARSGNLTEEAMARAIATLGRYQQIGRFRGVEELVIAATSATREAPNGKEFLERVHQELGLPVSLISGAEEARLIYLGVLSAVEMRDRPHVVMDIGGGSTELILGDGKDPTYLSSTKIGAVRLTDLFITTDPVSNSEFSRLTAYVQGMLERPTDELRILLDRQEVRLIGTSGTVETFAMLHAAQSLGVVPSPLHGYELPLRDLEELLMQLRREPLGERSLRIRQKRAEIIVAGGVILLEAMKLLGATQVMFCQRALREGLIVDWMSRHGYIEDRWQYQSTVRDRSVRKLADKYHVKLTYAEKVAELSLSLFDQLQIQVPGMLESTAAERHYLWAAAMLHNAGHHISHDAHHKHSYYLIRYGELLGYTESELEIIANLARYHRKSEPKKRHENFQRLPDERSQQFVRLVSPILRLGVALDRRQIGAIATVRVDIQGNQCVLSLTPQKPEDPCTLELWSLDYKKEPFERQFSLKLLPQLVASN
ncbi:MAG: Ppx/GppA family phosphatase [Oscillatoriales cyanobacterium SM2_2_1]|nr:Ppx/GppA family phosphatase [Oscillatoriales cyanobacterium SM2_2_1]